MEENSNVLVIERIAEEAFGINEPEAKRIFVYNFLYGFLLW